MIKRLNEAKDFLINKTGTAYKLGEAIFYPNPDDGTGNENKWSAVFFRPFTSSYETLSRALDIIKAPICLSLVALISLLKAIINLGMTLFCLCTLETDEFRKNFTDFIMFSVIIPIILIGAVLSAFTNLLDFLGSIITTSTACCSNEKPIESLSVLAQ